jgi:membrane protease YdiL (CAAX protease family)
MQENRVAHWSAVAFALIFPSVVTWVYFVLLADQAAWLQQGAYLVGKSIQFLFPVVWVFLVLGEKPSWPEPSARWLAAGIAFGLAVMATMIGLYHWVLEPMGLFDQAGEAVRQKILGLQLDTVWKYAALGVFYALFHSLLEEYYWRWFVFRRLRALQSPGPAICVSSLGFMAHHVIVLAIYFGWSSPWTYLFSIGVAAGGAVWAWLYERGRSIYSPWFSHLLVDAAIFLIGYDICRDLFQ